VYYITERYAIAVRRLRGDPRPWTTDPILRVYKFTNVKRQWDYTSQWLWQHWYSPHREARSVGFACAVARFTNYVPTLECIGYPKFINFERWRRELKERRANGNTIFTSAYHIVGGITTGADKIDFLIDGWLAPVWKSNILLRWYKDPFDLHHELRQLNGWGNFMAQEVVLDWMLTHYGDTIDDKRKERFAVPGPGARRGLNRLFGKEPTKSMTDESALEALRDAHHAIRPRLPQALQKNWTRHDTQFNLCEFDKYERALWDQGRPRNTYQPRSRSEQLTLPLAQLPAGVEADLRRIGEASRRRRPASRGEQSSEG
jgi:hypothetical protein